MVGVTKRTIWLWKVVQKIKVNKKTVKESVEAKNIVWLCRIKRKKDSPDGQCEANRRKNQNNRHKNSLILLQQRTFPALLKINAI